MSFKALTIAHRGGANLWPENTLEAFAHAIDMGADGIEFDLQLTADKKLALHHDDTLNPDITRYNGAYLQRPTPRIAELTLDQLAAYDVGRLDSESATGKRRNTQHPMDGCQIRDFADLCDLVLQKAPADFRLYAELKTNMENDASAAEALAEHFIRAIADHDILPYITVVSFDWRCLNKVLQALPDLPHAFTTLSFAATDPSHESAEHDVPDTPGALVRRASAKGASWWGGHDWRHQDGQTHGEKVLHAIAAAGGRGWFGERRDVTAQSMELATKLGLSVSAWTLNNPAEMKQLDALGVEAIITDRPDLMLSGSKIDVEKPEKA
ncbi:glycerophosphodiester phosphodiesterase family protein [Alphaproteobacteria bacterium]|nr:glycerophosphodiester phosphodiesterase family protein [Alphaproteobacteria bacterium]